jgi:DNA-binding NarL/FixJ family response regulator
MPLDVLLVEDQKILRELMRSALERDGEFRVAGEEGTGTGAIQACRALQPALVVMDLKLPEMNGIDAIVEIKRHCPGTRIVVLSMHHETEYVMSALSAGAMGFVVKGGSVTDLLSALRSAAKGGMYLSPEVSHALVHRLQRGEQGKDRGAAPLDSLSPRERQVLKMIAEGKSSKEIAAALDLGLETIRSYRKTMMRKLKVNNVAALTQFALATGVVSLPSMESDTL